MPQNQVEGVDIEQFMAFEGTTVDPVPEKNRADYQWWRAVHLGAVALNFMDGFKSLNLSGSRAESTVTFTDYETAKKLGKSLVGKFKDAPKHQFGVQEHHRFRELSGLDDDFAYPVLVHALAEVPRGKTVQTDPKTGKAVIDPETGKPKIIAKDYLIIDEESRTATFTQTLYVDYVDPFSQRFLNQIIKKSKK